MQINQTPSLSFNAIKWPSIMANDYKLTTRIVGDMVEHSKIYKEAMSSQIDVYFLIPSAKDEVAKVAYYDNKMGTFVRDKRDRLLITSATSKTKEKRINNYTLTERICNTLYKIIHGEYKAPNWYYNPPRYSNELEKICKKNHT